MRCNLITDRDNTVGLATDVELLQEFLVARGHQVTSVHWRNASEPADVNFFVEKFSLSHLETAPKRVGIFNLEWLSPMNLNAARIYMAQIWAKSAVAYETLIEQGCDQARFTGFLSRDPYNVSIKRERRVLHLAGRSTAKNTMAVLAAYRALGRNLPELSVVSYMPFGDLPPNVVQYGYSLARPVLDNLLNSHLFHLCPSEVEGWGHYITEATACKGVVITTDASPMHEHVLPTFGRLIAPSGTVCGVLVDRHRILPEQIIEELCSLDSCSDVELRDMGELARAWNRQRNTAFERSAEKLLEELAA